MGKKIICYPLRPRGGSKWDNNELRHSLRSLDEHWKGDYDEVCNLSERMPKWVNRDTVNFVMAPGYCDALKAAIKRAGEGGDILWMNDDIMFLKDCTWEDLVAPMHGMGVMNATSISNHIANGNPWKVRLGTIMRDLKSQGLPTIKFSTHTPYWYERDRLKVMWDKYGHLGYKVAIENAYFNTYLEELGGWKNFRDKFRASLNRRKIPVGELDRFAFLNLTDHGLSDWMKGFVAGRFPNKSKFEVA